MRPRRLRRLLVLAAFGAITTGAVLGISIGESAALASYPPSIGRAAGITVVLR